MRIFIMVLVSILDLLALAVILALCCWLWNHWGLWLWHHPVLWLWHQWVSHVWNAILLPLWNRLHHCLGAICN
jgi:hypothetical protein